jgi:hypothetical protein
LLFSSKIPMLHVVSGVFCFPSKMLGHEGQNNYPDQQIQSQRRKLLVNYLFLIGWHDYTLYFMCMIILYFILVLLHYSKN